MAQQPITIVWASTTSNTITINPTDQGNGIVYESDIVSDFLNGALSISSQAIRNLQVMGGYYNAGQDYKQYQFCSQLCYIDSSYQLNFYMATQNSPSLAPTNATSNQTGTTDMVLPINPTSTQSGWQQINLVPNQANIAYKNRDNKFTQPQTFISNATFNSDARFSNGLSITNGSISASGSSATFGTTTVSSLTCNRTACFTGNTTYFAPSASTTQSEPFGNFNRNASYSIFECSGGTASGSWIRLIASSQNGSPSGGVVGGVAIGWNKGGWNNMNFISQTSIRFNTAVTIRNASFVTVTFALDPEWEQDYATANYVNQKLQELYDFIDARLTTIEQRLGISAPTTLSRGISPRDAINEIAVPQSTIKQLFDRIEAMDGYNGVLGYSNAEERKEIAQVKNDESAVMQIVDRIKARKEQEEEEQRQREEQEKLELEAQKTNNKE